MLEVFWLQQHRAIRLVKPRYAVCASRAYLNMPYVSHDRQSVPKWMPEGNAVATAVYERVSVHTWASVNVCAHTSKSANLYVSVSAHEHVHVCMSVCPAQCAADTWHFPWSAYFNDFMDMNVFLTIDHVS